MRDEGDRSARAAVAAIEGRSGQFSKLEVRLKHFKRLGHRHGKMLPNGIGHLVGSPLTQRLGQFRMPGR